MKAIKNGSSASFNRESSPAAAKAKESLAALDFLVVQDLFLTETAALANVVFPAQSYAEKDGTFTNMEGSVLPIHTAMKAPGKARGDWQIFVDLARELGVPMAYGSAEEIRTEAAELVPALGELGVTNAERGIDHDSALTAYLGGHFLTRMEDRYNLPAKLNTVSKHETHLYVGDSLYHSGSLSTYNWGLMKVDGVDQLIMNSRDARKQKIKAGDQVRNTNEQGSVVVPVKPDPLVMPGTLFFPKHDTSSHVRDLVKVVEGSKEEGSVPQFRFTRVTMEKLAD